ncbi:unnamed protein product [Rotaria sp. Silwood1]|nr:unnamed protein product [Rotaria sp. Silwood1]
MNLINIAKHLLCLTQLEFSSEDSPASADEIFASQQLFEILKTFKDGYFHELYTYQSLDFHDEYNETTDEEDSTDEKESTHDENIGDYDENELLEIQTNFTLEEMKKIVELVDEHPNYKFASIKNRSRKEKKNEVGKREEKDLIVPPNDVVQASKSGKSSDEKHRVFLNEVLRRLVGRKFLLFLDCWTTQADLKKFREVFPH